MNRPPLRQAWSVRVIGSDGWSQLSPTIGITTTEQATLSLQPSDSFSTSLRTSNWTEPVPSVSVKAAISAGGKAAPTAASGGMWLASQAGYVVPFAATNGVSRV